jgi:hypothetical protein
LIDGHPKPFPKGTWMRLIPSARALLIGLASTGTAAVLAAPAHAAPSDPGYTCQVQLPAPLVWPAIVTGTACEATNGAPEQGDYRGTVRFVFPSPRFYPRTWDCRQSNARGDIHDPEDGRVVGQDCLPADDD